jgi:uncharacterized iron-regulated membrane protein
MAFLQNWLRRPQRVWFRRALFQVHLWTGIGVGLYIVAVCVSGSAVVFRAELTRYITRGPRTVVISGKQLTDNELRQIAQRDYPAYSVAQVWAAKKPTDAAEVWLARPGTSLQREFDPYTGKDLGNRQPLSLAFFNWLIDFHGNLALGTTGRIFNGVGGFLTTILCLTGMVIWWPGIGNWRHSMMAAWRGDWKRFNWELHSTVGFWMLLIIFLFAITGAYLVFTMPFERAINTVSPLRVYCYDISEDESCDDQLALGAAQIDPDNGEVLDAPANGPGPKLTLGDEFVRWAPRVHYGRFSGTGVKVLWMILGLAPPLLFLTGSIMWWNRVLRPEAWRARRKARLAPPDRTVEIQEVGPRLG